MVSVHSHKTLTKTDYQNNVPGNGISPGISCWEKVKTEVGCHPGWELVSGKETSQSSDVLSDHLEENNEAETAVMGGAYLLN